MRIFYIDESYDKKVYSLCGVIVTAKSYGKINRDFNKFLKKTCNLNEDDELKGDWLFNGRFNFKGLSLDERSEKIIKVAHFLAASTITKFIYTYICDYIDKVEAHLKLLELLISEAARITSKIKSSSTTKQLLAIFDQIDGTTEQNIYLELASRKKEIIKKYDKSCAFIDYGYSGISKYSRFLQIADFVAYFLRNYISTPFESNLFIKEADERKIQMLKNFKRIISKKLLMKLCKK